MTRSRWSGLLPRGRALAAAACLVAACSDSTGPAAGPPAAVQLVTGAGQTSAVATTLPQPIVVRVTDARGRPVKSAVVDWTVLSGGGTVAASPRTDDDGRLQATWTLGTAAGVQRLSATSETAQLQIEAVAHAGAAALIAAHAGDQQTAMVATAVAVKPAVVLRDAHDNSVAGVTVTCAVSAGGGSVVDGAPTTDDNGIATTGAWTMGTVVGNNTLTCNAAGLPAVTFTATGAAGVPAVLLVHAGDNQTTSLGSNVATPPAVRAFDAHDNPVPHAVVTFQVTAGGGSVTGATPLTGVDGTATIGSWRLGTVLGPNTLTATVAGGASVTFSAVATRDDGFALSVEGIHLNQGNQNAVGTIGGVAGRPGLLRVIVRASEANSYAPAVRVRLYNHGTLLREALIPAAQVGVPVSTDLNSASQTWNLTLTASEVVEGLSVEAIVDPENTITVDDVAKRYPREPGAALLDVAPLHPLRIAFIPIHATVQNRTGAISQANAISYLESVRQWIPGSSIETTVRAPYSTNLDLSVRDNWPRLLSEIQAVRTLEGAVDEYYHGIIGHFSGIPLGGIAYRPSHAVSTLRSGLSYDLLPHAAGTIAHEIGHNMGRMHNACGGPSGLDPNYPHADSDLGAPGYDVLNRVLKHSAQHRDYMSYCGPRWTSDYTYAGLLQWRRSDPLARPASSSLVSIAAAPVPGLFVWGRAGRAGVTLNPSFTLDARPVLPAAGGPNVLRGLAADGREVFRLNFESVAIEDGPDPGERHFAFFVPIAADQAEVVRLELSTPYGRAVRESPRAAQPPGAAAVRARPDVRLDAAADGAVRVRWDAARYPAALVRDAATGHVLAFAQNGDSMIAAGGVAPDRLEVLVSDGVHSERWQP